MSCDLPSPFRCNRKSRESRESYARFYRRVIDTLIEKGIRDDFIVLVGGAPLNEEFGAAVGADAYCRDAAVASETAQALVTARRAR